MKIFRVQPYQPNVYNSRIIKTPGRRTSLLYDYTRDGSDGWRHEEISRPDYDRYDHDGNDNSVERFAIGIRSLYEYIISLLES